MFYISANTFYVKVPNTVLINKWEGRKDLTNIISKTRWHMWATRCQYVPNNVSDGSSKQWKNELHTSI